jgi:hypothetical protein
MFVDWFWHFSNLNFSVVIFCILPPWWWPHGSPKHVPNICVCNYFRYTCVHFFDTVIIYKSVFSSRKNWCSYSIESFNVMFSSDLGPVAGCFAWWLPTVTEKYTGAVRFQSAFLPAHYFSSTLYNLYSWNSFSIFDNVGINQSTVGPVWSEFLEHCKFCNATFLLWVNLTLIMGYRSGVDHIINVIKFYIIPFYLFFLFPSFFMVSFIITSVLCLLLLSQASQEKDLAISGSLEGRG